LAGTTATLKFTSNEAGTYYYLVLSASAGAPSAATIQAQGTAVAKGSAAATASQNTVSVTGLTAGTQYKAYIVVKDAALNVSAVLTISGVNPVAFPTDGTLTQRLAWISSYATNNDDYTIELRANEAIAPTTLSYSGKTVKITLIGATTERTVSLSSPGSMFTVGSGVTLTLDDKVKLEGLHNNTNPLVGVNSGGKLAMKGTAKITGNTVSSSSFIYGGGVSVSGGSFIMSGSAAVSGNTVSGYGGGVYLQRLTGSTFTKNGGVIYGSETTTDATLRNVVTVDINTGAAIYVDDNHRRETTVSTNMSKSLSSAYIGQWSD
jgi:hypothetical protein